ncbi:MAG: hypothetical protein GY702_03205 [Desulfobulbaceae bacterium]|nr:hypothetical protein [Desulfobulbaceae bacterium]
MYRECIACLKDFLPKVNIFYNSVDFWDSRDPVMFEKELIALYEKRGWIISRRSVFGAKGSDIIGQKGDNQASFKLKKQDKPLLLSIARELLVLLSNTNLTSTS